MPRPPAGLAQPGVLGLAHFNPVVDFATVTVQPEVRFVGGRQAPGEFQSPFGIQAIRQQPRGHALQGFRGVSG